MLEIKVCSSRDVFWPPSEKESGVMLRMPMTCVFRAGLRAMMGGWCADNGVIVVIGVVEEGRASSKSRVRVHGRSGSRGLSGISLGNRCKSRVRAKIKRSKQDLLSKRLQDKLPFGDSNVRNCEALMVELDVVIEKDIEVNVTRALVNDLFATKGVLDILESIQKGKWLKSCLNLRFSFSCGSDWYNGGRRPDVPHRHH